MEARLGVLVVEGNSVVADAAAEGLRDQGIGVDVPGVTMCAIRPAGGAVRASAKPRSVRCRKVVTSGSFRSRVVHMSARWAEVTRAGPVSPVSPFIAYRSLIPVLPVKRTPRGHEPGSSLPVRVRRPACQSSLP